MLTSGPAGRRRVIVVGDVTTDVVAVLHDPVATDSDTPARIQVSSGGQAANTACWLARHDHPVTLLSCVGDDWFGRARQRELSELGVDCAFQWCTEAGTGTVIVLSQGCGRSMLTDRGANTRLSGDGIDAVIAGRPDAGHLHLSGYVLLDPDSRPAGLHALALARSHGLTTSVDAASVQPLREAGIDNCLSWLAGIDLLLANEAEAAVLSHGLAAESAACALTTVAQYVVVKRGAAGAVWAGRDGALLRVRARPVEVADTTGAGDAFAAGLLSALIDGRPPASATARGVDFGAAAASTVGGYPAARART